MSSSLSIVYVLTNSAMPGLVKIGYTAQDDANSRIAQLYTTGVPVPFSIEYACKVQNAEEVEKALYVAFGPNRINPKREFFRIEPDQAIAILKLLHTEEATQEVTDQPSMIDQQSIAAAEQLRARRPNLNFDEMGIPVGIRPFGCHRYRGRSEEGSPRRRGDVADCCNQASARPGLQRPAWATLDLRGEVDP